MKKIVLLLLLASSLLLPAASVNGASRNFPWCVYRFHHPGATWADVYEAPNTFVTFSTPKGWLVFGRGQMIELMPGLKFIVWSDEFVQGVIVEKCRMRRFRVDLGMGMPQSPMGDYSIPSLPK